MYFTLKFLAPDNQVAFLCWIAGKLPNMLLVFLTSR